MYDLFGVAEHQENATHGEEEKVTWKICFDHVVLSRNAGRVVGKEIEKAVCWYVPH